MHEAEAEEGVRILLCQDMRDRVQVAHDLDFARRPFKHVAVVVIG